MISKSGTRARVFGGFAIVAAAFASIATPPAATAEPSATASTPCTRAAQEQAPATGELRFSCADSLLTTATTRPGGVRQEILTNVATGKSADLTGTTGTERAQRSAAVAGEAGAVQPLRSDIVDEHHAYTEDTAVYGRIENGVITFQSRYRLRSQISLQQRHHWVQVSWTQLDNREITIDIPVRMNRDVPAWFDETVDTTLYGGNTYETQRTEHHYLSTPNGGDEGEPAGVFYWEMYNLVLHDRYEGNFPSTISIEAPHFRCYKTVPCKYPNGQEA